MSPHDRVCFILRHERFRGQYRATKVTTKMLFSVDFFIRPFDHFLFSDAPGGYRQERTVVHEDSQWGGSESAPTFQIRRAADLHQVLFTIQDAATQWYPSDLADVFRAVHGDSVRALHRQSPQQLLHALCNLYQAVFSDVFDDLIHGAELWDVGSRALGSLRRDSPAYERFVTRVMNDAVVHSVLHGAPTGLHDPRGSRSPPRPGRDRRRTSRAAGPRPEAGPTMIPPRIRSQIPVVNGTQVCVRFQTAKGCTFPTCKHRHELHRLPPDVLTWISEVHTGLQAAHPQRE